MVGLEISGMKSLVDGLDLRNLDFPDVRHIESTVFPDELGVTELDGIWMAILIEIYMFCQGFVNVAETISRYLEPLVTRLEPEKVALADDIFVYRSLSAAFANIRNRVERPKPIYMIGDKCALVPAWQFSEFEDGHFQFVPVYIRRIRSSGLVSHRKSSFQSCYREELGKIEDGSLVILCFSEIDFRENLLELDGKGRIVGYAELRELAVRDIVRIAKHICQSKRCRVWVHPILRVSTGYVGHTRLEEDMNDYLSWKVWTLNGEIPEVKMLDFSDAMLVEVDGLQSWRTEIPIELIGKTMEAESRLEFYVSRHLTKIATAASSGA
jgi:hypothetical protein